MIFFTAIAAVMFTAWPELCPSPCPGAPSMIGSCHATPGFCDACGMQSMSEPSAMTGLPGSPRRHERGRDARDPFLDREAVLLQDVDQVAVGFELLEPELAVAEDLIDHLLRELALAVDVRDGFLLQGVELDGRR